MRQHPSCTVEPAPPAYLAGIGLAVALTHPLGAIYEQMSLLVLSVLPTVLRVGRGEAVHVGAGSDH